MYWCKNRDRYCFKSVIIIIIVISLFPQSNTVEQDVREAYA